MSEPLESVDLSPPSMWERLDGAAEAHDLHDVVAPMTDEHGDGAPLDADATLEAELPESRVYPGTDVPLADKLASARARQVAADTSPADQHPLIRELLLTPGHWHIWPAVAVLRWMLRQASADGGRLIYRSTPSLGFSPGEVDEVEVTGAGVVGLVLRAPGIAAPGSPLPTSDILRIMQDQRRGGAIAHWLDGFGDRFMHAVETAQAQNNVAFALASGGEIPTLRAVSHIVGRSAPLASDGDGVLDNTWTRPPRGALGLAPFFLGAISASNLRDLVEAFVGIAVRVVEFAGARIAIARPARIGVGAFGSMLGTSCNLATAGIDIVLEGGSDHESLKWARDASRRRSLYRLAGAFIGAPSPASRFYLEVDGAVVPPAKLGAAQLGGVAVLGKASGNVRLPIANR